MKKILFAAAAALTICASAYTYYQQDSSVALNNLALANVEALAQGETSGTGTLYGNSAGSLFCCCSGSTRTCGASSCSGC